MTVTLNQLIDQVREELLSPRQANTPEEMYPFLFIEEVEIEMGVTVSSTAGAGGKVNIQVVEIGSDVTATEQQTHCIKVKLTPLFTKEETRRLLEQKTGPHVMQKIEDTSLQGTAKDFG